MRIWDIVPIRKTPRPDHKLRIQIHAILMRKETKEVICGHRSEGVEKEKSREIPIEEKERLQLSGSRDK
jgi:hypothetical protein